MTATFLAASAMTIQRGDIIQLGPHRLMCGDCTDQISVRRLLGVDRVATAIFSPPYLDRRTYAGGKLIDGTTLFCGALSAMATTQDVQVFAVVGNMHKDNEQSTYYEEWITGARKLGWRRFSTYIWDKQHGLPGHWSGRLAPCFEWIFHLNKKPRDPQKIYPTLWGNGRHVRKGRYSKGNTIRNNCAEETKKITAVSDFKIDNNIIRINPSGLAQGIGHPAVYPYQLPQRLLMSYCSPNGVVYDPMAGSGSTMIAADTLGLTCVSCEISEEYCQIAVDRYWRHKEKSLLP